MKKEDPKNFEMPEGEGRGSRFESAELDIEELTEFFKEDSPGRRRGNP